MHIALTQIITETSHVMEAVKKITNNHMTYQEFLAMNPYHGMPVTCEIDGKEIRDAKLSQSNEGIWYICQNYRRGSEAADKLGYRFSCKIQRHQNLESVGSDITNLRPLNTHPLAGLKAGDYIKDKRGYYKRVLSDVMHPELDDLATTIVSLTEELKTGGNLKKAWGVVTLFELEGYVIDTPEPTKTPREVTMKDVVEKFGEDVVIKKED